MSTPGTPSIGPPKQIVASVGEELRDRPASIVDAQRRKFGVERSAKQRSSSILSQGRATGVKLPSYSPSKFSK